jgi:hypothetical protein
MTRTPAGVRAAEPHEPARGDQAFFPELLPVFDRDSNYGGSGSSREGQRPRGEGRGWT